MPPNKNTDRVVKRILPWIILLGLIGLTSYIFLPNALQYTFIPARSEAINGSAALIPEQHSIVDELIEMFTSSKQTKQTSVSASDTKLSVNEPHRHSNNAAEGVSNHGEFVKRLATFEHQKNYWQYIRRHHENPTLIQQLNPLRKHLSRASLTRVEILYSDYVKNGHSNPENSKIIAVRGTEGSKTWLYYARFEGREVRYYDYDGNAPEPSMDRAPLRYTRITSHFNPRRRHPVSGRIRPHNGVDFKAAYGTKIHSTGNGIVTFAGWQHGYGRIVIIKHPNGYETRYAHLSAISVHVGQSIKRGQVVGKLGNSGISTGPHLHYEVRVNGEPKDPMTISLPSFKPIARSYLGIWHFRAEQYQIAMKELAESDYTIR